ncbi:hypothetical protein BDF22DRAFT_220560 [Syncephalis plumigaleata]|nr:hypothetical protein BDF22DRAFT_220560 [Syncephalis plumigaleata]
MKGQHIPLVVVALLLLVLYVVTLVFLWRCRHISPLQQPRTQSSTQQQQHASIIITGGGLLTVLAFTFHFLLTNWYLLAPLFTDSLSSSTRCTSWLWVLSLAWPIWTLAILSRAVYYWLAWEGQRGMVKEAEWRRRTRAMQHVASSNSNGGAPRRSTAVSDDGTLTSSASISPYRSIYSTSVTSNGLTCVKSYGHGEMTSDPNIHSMLNNDTLPSQKHHEASNGNTYTTPPIDGTEETEEQSFSDSNTDLEGQRKHAIQMELIHQWLQPSRLPLFVITISVVLMLGLSLPLQSTLDTSYSYYRGNGRLFLLHPYFQHHP